MIANYTYFFNSVYKHTIINPYEDRNFDRHMKLFNRYYIFKVVVVFLMVFVNLICKEVIFSHYKIVACWKAFCF